VAGSGSLPPSAKGEPGPQPDTTAAATTIAAISRDLRALTRAVTVMPPGR
jgi:hypothetical protein